MRFPLSKKRVTERTNRSREENGDGTGPKGDGQWP